MSDSSKQLHQGGRRRRLAVVASHPVPYHITIYRAVAKDGRVDVKAFFASRIGVDNKPDPGMGVSIAWKTDLLSGYEHEFLPGAEKIENTSFAQLDNKGVGKALAAWKPDAVIILGYTQRTMMRAIAWCRLNGVPALMLSDSSLHSGTSKPVQFLKRMLLPLVFRQFSAQLSIGDANAKYLQTFGVSPEQIFRVPYQPDEGFRAYRAKREDARKEWRQKLGISDETLVVLFVGKLIARKRPGDLLEALAELKKSPRGGRPVKVLYAGDGAERAQLERRARELDVPAQFLGFVNIDTLPALFCAADALAHPAEIETFGVIVAEAAILGLPLVLSDRVGAIGPTSIARPDVNTLTYPCADVQALAGAISRLANDDALVRRLSQASLAIADELDTRQAVRGTLEALDYCLGKQEYAASGSPA